VLDQNLHPEARVSPSSPTIERGYRLERA